MGREDIDKLVREAYRRRVAEDVAGVCDMFAPEAEFRFVAAPKAEAHSFAATGQPALRPLMEQLVKTFQLKDFSLKAVLIDGNRVAAHWNALSPFDRQRAGARDRRARPDGSPRRQDRVVHRVLRHGRGRPDDGRCRLKKRSRSLVSVAGCVNLMSAARAALLRPQFCYRNMTLGRAAAAPRGCRRARPLYVSCRCLEFPANFWPVRGRENP